MKHAGIEWCEIKNRGGSNCSNEAKWIAVAPKDHGTYKMCESHKKYYEELDSKQPIPGYKFEPLC